MTSQWILTSLTCLLLWAGSAHAQPSPPSAEVEPAALEEAQACFRRALRRYDQDDYPSALVEFQRAYELAPTFRILYNIAQVQFQLQDHAAALLSFQKYLEDGGERIAEARRTEVEHDIEMLRERVGSLVISTSEPGAEVYVDDVSVGTSPLSVPTFVNAGRRKVTARLKGFLPISKHIEVERGGTASAHLELQALEAESPPSSPEPKPPSSFSKPEPLVDIASPQRPAPGGDQRAVPWVGWAIAGGLAAGATVTGVLALRASSDLDDKRGTANVGREALDDASRSAQGYAIATDALGAGALIAGGISLYLTLDGTAAPRHDAAAALRVRLAPGSMGVSGTF